MGFIAVYEMETAHLVHGVLQVLLKLFGMNGMKFNLLYSILCLLVGWDLRFQDGANHR